MAGASVGAEQSVGGVAMLRVPAVSESDHPAGWIVAEVAARPDGGSRPAAQLVDFPGLSAN
ncbi:hypothetical protein Misp04_63340 [Micromonospora sp. NBRC 101691]|nr:hypothetical protein Misp04_63340 [Micromonospora sp. NBRC 101691]